MDLISEQNRRRQREAAAAFCIYFPGQENYQIIIFPEAEVRQTCSAYAMKPKLFYDSFKMNSSLMLLKKNHVFMPLLPSCYGTADFCEAMADLHSIAGDEWQAGWQFNPSPFSLAKIRAMTAGYLFGLSKETGPIRSWSFPTIWVELDTCLSTMLMAGVW